MHIHATFITQFLKRKKNNKISMRYTGAKTKFAKNVRAIINSDSKVCVLYTLTCALKLVQLGYIHVSMVVIPTILHSNYTKTFSKCKLHVALAPVPMHTYIVTPMPHSLSIALSTCMDSGSKDTAEVKRQRCL